MPHCVRLVPRGPAVWADVAEEDGAGDLVARAEDVAPVDRGLLAVVEAEPAVALELLLPKN